MKGLTLTERFEAKYVVVEPGDCWVWMGAVDSKGYGQIWVNRHISGAHRVSWELRYGPIPDELWVLHRCDVGCCVNPTHLYLGSHDDNMADMVKKNRSTTGGRNPSAKLTAANIREIRAIAQALSKREIAQRFGVSDSQIRRIICGEHWHESAAPEAPSGALLPPRPLQAVTHGRPSSSLTCPASGEQMSGSFPMENTHARRNRDRDGDRGP